MNLEVPVMLPNGDLLMCSQDFGAEHVIGNLLRQSVDEIFGGEPMRRFLTRMAEKDSDIMCRSCNFAIETHPAQGTNG